MRTNKRLLVSLALASMAGFAQAQAPAPRPAGPAAAVAPTPALPPAEVPAAVAVAKPSPAEVEQVRAGLKRLESSDRQLGPLLKKYPELIEVRTPRANTAIVPQLQGGFLAKHQANVEVARTGQAELLLMGDSITDFWRNPEGAYAGKPVLDKYFGQWKIANFGIAGDTTQGVLYRLHDGEGTGFSPRAIMLMIGTNNTGRNTAGEIAEGIGAVVLQLRRSFPQAKILLLGVFPRSNAQDPLRGVITDINQRIAKLHDGNNVHYLDIGAKFLDANGDIPRDVMSDGLHPGPRGYEIWAEAVREPLTRLMAR